MSPASCFVHRHARFSCWLLVFCLAGVSGVAVFPLRSQISLFANKDSLLALEDENWFSFPLNVTMSVPKCAVIVRSVIFERSTRYILSIPRTVLLCLRPGALEAQKTIDIEILVEGPHPSNVGIDVESLVLAAETPEDIDFPASSTDDIAAYYVAHKSEFHDDSGAEKFLLHFYKIVASTWRWHRWGKTIVDVGAAYGQKLIQLMSLFTPSKGYRYIGFEPDEMKRTKTLAKNLESEGLLNFGVILPHALSSQDSSGCRCPNNKFFRCLVLFIPPGTTATFYSNSDVTAGWDTY